MLRVPSTGSGLTRRYGVTEARMTVGKLRRIAGKRVPCLFYWKALSHRL
ncbi:hypothetical protein ID866_7270 [Astraeus odoratus]|nr:hypothetical protein ID866_7270 [Astraeus odoratus]